MGNSPPESAPAISDVLPDKLGTLKTGESSLILGVFLFASFRSILKVCSGQEDVDKVFVCADRQLLESIYFATEETHWVV